jgi:hypothetical protein
VGRAWPALGGAARSEFTAAEKFNRALDNTVLVRYGARISHFSFGTREVKEMTGNCLDCCFNWDHREL